MDVARPSDDRIWAYLALVIASTTSLIVMGILLIKGQLIAEAEAKYAAAKAEFENVETPLDSPEEAEIEREENWAWVEGWIPNRARIQTSLNSQIKKDQTIHVFANGTMVMLGKDDAGGKARALELLRTTELSLKDLMVKPTPDGNFLIRYGTNAFFYLYKDTAAAYQAKVDETWEMTLSPQAREARKGKKAPDFAVRCALISLYLLEKDKSDPKIILSIDGSKSRN